MKDVYNSEELEALRHKLYARSGAANAVEKRRLTDQPVDVSRNWNLPEQAERHTQDLRQSITVNTADREETDTPKPRRRYRAFILVASLLIFIFGVGLSSLYLYFGGNQVSSEQIGFTLSGPFSVGGGEVVDLQVGITNDNDVPIESATLIMKYPPGSRSVGEAPRTLFEERIPIRDIAPGEARVVPVKVAVFGEEQSTQTITASLEYRIAGSGGTFYKDAPELAFSISSSPLLVRLDSVEKVASGQTVDVTMTVISNASSPLENILISAQYPNGFRFESAEPAPVFGDNIWRVDQLLPEQSTTITFTGVVIGLTQESFTINVDAGQAQPNNPFIVGSLLAESSLDFFIERPFIDVVTAIDGNTRGPVVIEQGASSVVTIDVTNTLEESVYDMYVEVIPGGNVLSDRSISANSGFFDSNTGTVRWEVSNNSSFAVVRPGETRSLSFSVNPTAPRATASYDLVVNVYARRVAERSAAEQLVGTALVEAQFSSEVFAGSQAGHNGGIFTDVGPLPPTVGTQTTYTITMVARAGVNDLTDTIMNASLPIHVSWLDAIEGDGEIVYNSVSKQLEWRAGNILAGEQKQVHFQVAITPSSSQIGSAPVLLNAQTLRATDRFTSERLQASGGEVYTELSTEAGFAEDNGVVQR
jgi:hypothetical protein